jgi:hypothetical protein
VILDCRLRRWNAGSTNARGECPEPWLFSAGMAKYPVHLHSRKYERHERPFLSKLTSARWKPGEGITDCPYHGAVLEEYLDASGF